MEPLTPEERALLIKVRERLAAPLANGLVGVPWDYAAAAPLMTQVIAALDLILSQD